MPQCCDDCFALDDNGDYPTCRITHTSRGYNFNVREKRMPDCQLINEEPRVLTLEELDAIYQTKELHTWPFNTPPYLWMTVNPDARWIRGFWIHWRDLMYSLENNTAFYVRENYGKVWKIWTVEPTDEQIKAVKWE